MKERAARKSRSKSRAPRHASTKSTGSSAPPEMSADQLTRDRLFASAAEQLRRDFEARRREIPHAALRGGEVELLVRKFLVEHIPRRFDVGSGFILDAKDARSKQTDVIVYDALNCPRYRVSETASIFPADNVAAVVEVKSRLDGASLNEAFDNLRAAKALVKARLPDVGATLSQTHGSVFAFESSLSLSTIASRYAQWVKDLKGFGTHPDAVCVLDKGLVTTVSNLGPRTPWSTAFIEVLRGAEGASFGLGTLPLGEGTLDGWFRLLLGHLILFRPVVDHRGFDWGRVPGGMTLTYLGSCSNEPDPVRRAQLLASYRQEFQFKSKP